MPSLNTNNNTMTHTLSTFNTESFAMMQNIMNAIAKVHTAYNAYAEASNEADAHMYDENTFVWCNLYDVECKKEANLRKAIREFSKVIGPGRVRSTIDGRDLKGGDSSYSWIRAFNDMMSEYSTFNHASYEVYNVIAQVSKMADYNNYLPC